MLRLTILTALCGVASACMDSDIVSAYTKACVTAFLPCGGTMPCTELPVIPDPMAPLPQCVAGTACGNNWTAYWGCFTDEAATSGIPPIIPDMCLIVAASQSQGSSALAALVALPFLIIAAILRGWYIVKARKPAYDAYSKTPAAGTAMPKLDLSSFEEVKIVECKVVSPIEKFLIFSECGC